MTRRRARPDERLHRPPFRLPRPAGGIAGAVRWLVATGLLGLAALLLAAGPPPVVAGPSSAVLTAARDLPGGVALTTADLRLVRLPRPLVPRGALSRPSAALGRIPAGPVRAGEALTDVRLLGPALVRATGGDGAVAAPVRIADPAVVALLRPGDRVDVVAAGGETPGAASAARVVASDLTVIAVPPPATDGAAEGALIVLAAPPDVAARLVAAATTARLSLTVRGR